MLTDTILFQNTLLYLELNGLCTLIFLALLIKHINNGRKEASQRLFRWVLVCCIALLCLDSIAFLVNGHVTNAPLAANYLANVAYFVVIGLTGYLWYLYSEAEQNPQQRVRAGKRLFEALPMLVLAAAACVTPFTDWVFTIDDSGMYHRGPLYFLQVIVCVGYLLAASLLALIRARSTKDFDQRQRMVLLSTFCIPVLLAGAVQVVLPQTPLLCIGATFSLLFVYNEMQNRLIAIDPLTQVNNRYQLTRVLNERIQDAQEALEKQEEAGLTLLIVDIDGFKEINDAYGHIEGDKALIRVGKALKHACHGHNVGIYRYGGDEFVIVFNKKEEDDIEGLKADIAAELAAENERWGAPFDMTVSIGSIEYEPDIKTPAELIRRADKALYEGKHAKRSTRSAT